jgi:hypothetical protein
VPEGVLSNQRLQTCHVARANASNDRRTCSAFGCSATHLSAAGGHGCGQGVWTDAYERLGCHAGEIETFIEVEFDLDGKKVIPDGLIRVSRESRIWTALVEVKAGRNELQAEQLENYLEVARRHGLQALLTISNQTSVADGVHPTKIDKRKLKHVDLHHLAWNEVLSRAVVEKEHRGVADPDQAYVLDELIRYLEHPRSLKVIATPKDDTRDDTNL